MPANLTAAQWMSWTSSDEQVLVNFLHDHRAASGDGANFKMATFQAAAAILEAGCTTGGPKTAKACQNKWASVCLLYFISKSFLTMFCSNAARFGPFKQSSTTWDGIGATKMVQTSNLIKLVPGCPSV